MTEAKEYQFGLLNLTSEATVVENAQDYDEDETTEDGILFYVNKSGFPIDDFTCGRMWTHVARLHPDGKGIEKDIRNKKNLPEVAYPKPPIDFPLHYTIDEKIFAVQEYMNQLQYNHTGTQFFEIRKNRPLTGLMEIAKEMIREALPIKCLEAVILSVYLTNGLTSLDRFPLSFKTMFTGNTYRHVACGLYSAGRYGALGMSRRKELMYKPLEFKGIITLFTSCSRTCTPQVEKTPIFLYPLLKHFLYWRKREHPVDKLHSLSDLLLDYIAAYKKYFHDVTKVVVGLPIVHDSHSYESIEWKHLTVIPRRQKRDEMCRDIDRHAREMRHLTRRGDVLKSTYSIAADKPRGLTESPKKSPQKDVSRPSRRKNPTNTSEHSAEIETGSSVMKPRKSKAKCQSSPDDEEQEEGPSSKPVLTSNYQIRV